MDLPLANLGSLQVLDGRHALHRVGVYQRAPLDRLTGVAIHHTVTHPRTEPATIAYYHVEKRGWPAIGYHLLVYDDGQVVLCLDLEEYGAHVRWRSAQLLGVALVGDYTLEPPTEAHLRTAYRVIAELQTLHGAFLPVDGHRQLATPTNPTACPGSTWPQWLPHLRRVDTSQDDAMMGEA